MNMIKTGAIHHLALTVTDSERSRDFYVNLLGFQVLAEFESTRILSNGGLVLAVKPAPDPARAPKNDRFDENRVGLDHLCLSLTSLADLEKAMETLDAQGIPHGQIEDLGDTGVCAFTLRDPDNIQIELSAAKE